MVLSGPNLSVQLAGIDLNECRKNLAGSETTPPNARLGEELINNSKATASSDLVDFGTKSRLFFSVESLKNGFWWWICKDRRNFVQSPANWMRSKWPGRPNSPLTVHFTQCRLYVVLQSAPGVISWSRITGMMPLHRLWVHLDRTDAPSSEARKLEMKLIKITKAIWWSPCVPGQAKNRFPFVPHRWIAFSIWIFHLNFYNNEFGKF